MYSDEMFYLYCTSCKPGFCSSALSSVYVEEVSISPFCVTRYLERNEVVWQTDGNVERKLRTVTDGL